MKKGAQKKQRTSSTRKTSTGSTVTVKVWTAQTTPSWMRVQMSRAVNQSVRNVAPTGIFYMYSRSRRGTVAVGRGKAKVGLHCSISSECMQAATTAPHSPPPPHTHTRVCVCVCVSYKQGVAPLMAKRQTKSANLPHVKNRNNHTVNPSHPHALHALQVSFKRIFE